ncbi:MAG: GTPase [Planctomycetota bacterium]
MDTSATIAACATSMAASERALLRVSGAHAFDAIDAIAAAPIERTRGVGPIRLRLRAGELPTLAVRLPGPRSYTGEDTVELLPPGSPTLVEMVLAALLAHDSVRLAEPGEFTARAYLHGRLTLQQAEGVAARIAADSRAELDASERLLSGAAGGLYARLTDELASALALVEVAADFADEEHVEPIAAADLRDRLRSIRDTLATQRPAKATRATSSGRPLVVLAGPPNAGKTSLFNALLGRRRGMDSPRPHATRDAIIEPLELPTPAGATMAVDLCDLPGTADDGELLDAGEADTLRRVIEDALGRADLVLTCDPKAPPPGATGMIPVRTKADLDLAEATGSGALSVSAATGLNLDRLRSAIAETIADARSARDAGLLPRHAALVGRAMAALDDALGLIAGEGPIETELAAAGMRAALDALGELGGAVSADDVIGRIFASFCIGK